MKKKALPIQLDETERKKLEILASNWGISLSSAVRRLIREYKSQEPSPKVTEFPTYQEFL